METIQPALKNGRNTWDRINMPASEFQERVKAVREKMAARGIDLLLAYGNGFNEYANPCYLSNYVIRLPRGTLFLLTKDNEAALFFEGAARGIPSMKKSTWVEDLRACPDISRGCVQYLEEKALRPVRVGFAGLSNLMPHDQLDFLTNALDHSDIVEGESIIEGLRMVKSQRELDQIRRASRIVKGTFDTLPERPFSEMNERVVEAMIHRAARLDGAEDVRVLIGRPRAAPWALRPVDDASLKSGETLIVYLAVAYERYWSEGIRTFTAADDTLVKSPLDDAEALWGRLAACLAPGKSVSQCCGEAMGEIQKSEVETIDGYGFGQGIGLSLNERPTLDPQETGELTEGMCFSFRLSLKDQKLGAIMIGQTLGLSEGGVEIFTA